MARHLANFDNKNEDWLWHLIAMKWLYNSLLKYQKWLDSNWLLRKVTKVWQRIVWILKMFAFWLQHSIYSFNFDFTDMFTQLHFMRPSIFNVTWMLIRLEYLFNGNSSQVLTYLLSTLSMIPGEATHFAHTLSSLLIIFIFCC